ncbi:MAG: ABC transporter ATP-binding protein [Candidatus Gygaella obscura]|nr:ABC transporter ATP-binding protein [Candidatus Gygaella obscura]
MLDHKDINYKLINIGKLKKFLRFMLPYWKIKGLAIFIGLIVVLLGLVNPYLSKLIIDQAYPQRNLNLLLILAVGIGIILLVKLLLTAVESIINKNIALKVNFDIKQKFIKIITRLELVFFQDSSIGENIYKLSYDIETVSGFIINSIQQMIRSVVKLILILCVVFYLDWKLSLLAVILIPLTCIPSYFLTLILRKILHKTIEIQEQIISKMYAIFSNIYLIKAFAKELEESHALIRKLIKFCRLKKSTFRLEAICDFLSALLSRAAIGLIILYGGVRVFNADMTLGSLTAILIYLNQLINMNYSFVGLYQSSVFASVSCERLDKILQEDNRANDDYGTLSVLLKNGRIEFNNVTFAYNNDKLILKDLSFVIDDCVKIALVGYSGRGKTTILLLILRLFQIKTGCISVSDYDIKRLNFKCLREHIGIALQEPFLFNDTIINNIRFAKPHASKEEVKLSARLAEVDEFIVSLPDGYETNIGDNACKLSQGQKQRIAIARAIIKQPKIIILDEAMSSIDTDTESKIIDNLKHDFPNSTIIIVSHRINTVEKMDSVYFLSDNGNIFNGTHSWFLDNNPEYAQLFNKPA